jgi:hypothetical protein
MAVINKIRGSKAPNLPISPVEYSQRYHDQYSNVLRLYFNELDNLFAALFSDVAGGHHLSFPYGAFTQDGNTTLSVGISNVSTTPIQVASTAGFSTTGGFIVIENEIIQYTAISGNTFTGITRGVKSTTNVAHLAGVAVTEAGGVAAGSSEAVVLDAVDYSNGIFVGGATANTLPSSRIYVSYDGIYNLQFSMQLLNYSNAEDNVTVWLKKNGTDVPLTASVEQVNSKHGSSPGATIMALNIFQQLTAGQYMELYWASDSGNTVLATYPPGTAPVHPASPSAIVTVSFVSALP